MIMGGITQMIVRSVNMFKKNKFGKIITPLLLCLLAAAVLLIGIAYFNFISKKIYEDSTDHLSEIYDQVNRSFGAFVDRNWGLLESWDEYFAKENPDPAAVSDFIAKEKEYWGFSDFYFLSGGEAYMTASGSAGTMDLGDAKTNLTEQGEPIMAGDTPESGRDVIVFAAPAAPGSYNGFEYDAVAVSYNNADMASSLNVDAFSGKAKCFVVHNDGSVLLSTQTGGNVFENFLVYLKAASDISPDVLSQIGGDWQNGRSGLLQCKIGGVNYCILYQPVGYQDYILLSAVPQSVLSAGFLSVQKVTMNVLIIIFLLIGAAVIALLILRGRRLSRLNKTELRYRERMFDLLSNSVDDIFIMLDSANHNVDYISPNIERLLGIPLKDAQADIRVLEKCALGGDIVIPRDELEAIPLNGSKHRDYEYMHQSTGERRWYRMTVYHMSIADVKKYIIVLSDRTRDQLMNQKLQEALDAAKSANEAKSNFLSNMSHDIRTPMNAIVGFSVLLEKDADDPDLVREYTRKITASSHHLLSLINDVLDMSKIESGKTSLNVDCFSLPALFEELGIILMPQAKAKKQTFKTIVKGAPPEQLVGDKLRLNQILINLLSNAIKYTPDGGEIEFIVSELPSPTPQFAKIRFTVRDNGIGMSEEFLEQVFNPFSREISSVTNKIQGTGLGMAITKNLVDLMGGIINVESAPGKGSTFTVELTFTVPDAEEPETWLRRKIPRMLVADDEEDICLSIKELMRGTGVDVSFATDGASAVSAAVKAHKSGSGFNVILLDWKMPGMDGVEAAREIRAEIGADVPILVLTSYDWTDIETEARKAGINAFMPKPFFVSTLKQTLEPLFTDKDGTAAERTAEDDKVMEGLRFLVAEDNELNAEILKELLGMEGAECEIAVNGKEAVEIFENSAPEYYDMILMDVQMPIMNGYDATRAIRSLEHPSAKTVPIAAMTANTFAEDVRDALNSGMDGHLSKPIDMAAVKELVAKLINNKNNSGDGPKNENGGD